MSREDEAYAKVKAQLKAGGNPVETYFEVKDDLTNGQALILTNEIMRSNEERLRALEELLK